MNGSDDMKPLRFRAILAEQGDFPLLADLSPATSAHPRLPLETGGASTQ